MCVCGELALCYTFISPGKHRAQAFTQVWIMRGGLPLISGISKIHKHFKSQLKRFEEQSNTPELMASNATLWVFGVLSPDNLEQIFLICFCLDLNFSHCLSDQKSLYLKWCRFLWNRSTKVSQSYLFIVTDENLLPFLECSVHCSGDLLLVFPLSSFCCGHFFTAIILQE